MWVDSVILTPRTIILIQSASSDEGSTCQRRRRETQVQSLSQDDPPEEGMATHPSILAWENP